MHNRFKKYETQDKFDLKFDIQYVYDGGARLGYLANFKTITIQDDELNE